MIDPCVFLQVQSFRERKSSVIFLGRDFARNSDTRMQLGMNHLLSWFTQNNNRKSDKISEKEDKQKRIYTFEQNRKKKKNPLRIIESSENINLRRKK